MFLGKAVITGLTGLIAYIIIMNSKLNSQVTSPIFPTIVSAVIAYLISSVFLSVYSFASTAILHCFIMNEDIGVSDHPQCLNGFLQANDDHNAKKNKGASSSDKNDKQAVVIPNEQNKNAPPAHGPNDVVVGGDGRKANNMT